MQLILASASQGRKQLLSLFKIPFQVIPSTVDEDKIIGKNPLETIQLRARGKGEEIAKKLSNPTTYNLKPTTYLILSADSGAILDNKLIGKPKDEKEAQEILQNFSGRTHDFITAIYVIKTLRGGTTFLSTPTGLPSTMDPAGGGMNGASLGGAEKSVARPQQSFEQAWQIFDRSWVTMKRLTEEDINLHLKLSDYTKYAGGYALFASPIDLITKVEGSLTNVVGLPLEKLLPILIENQLIHF